MQVHAAAVRQQLPQLGVRRISNLLWAHAKLGHRGPASSEDDALVGDMVQALHGSLHEASTRDLANTLWALASLGFEPPRKFLADFGQQVRVG